MSCTKCPNHDTCPDADKPVSEKCNNYNIEDPEDGFVRKKSVLDAIDNIDWYHQNEKTGEMVRGANTEYHQPWYRYKDVYDAIRSIPPENIPKVTFCKDCEFVDTEKCPFARADIDRGDNDFCSKGRKR